MDLSGILPVVFGACVILAILVIVVLKRRPKPEPKQVDLRIDVGTLGPTTPPTMGPRLEIRHVPVRLALLVLAPVGRGKQLPSSDTAERADAIVPGLASCLRTHGTRVVCWPPQLSSQGFMQAFFGSAPLPGNRGQGTVWCAAAGKCDAEQGPFLVGMLLSAERPNALGQLAVNSSHEWFDLLRVKDDS